MCSALHHNNIDGVWEEIKRFQHCMGLNVAEGVKLTSAQKSRLRRLEEAGGAGGTHDAETGERINYIARRRGEQSRGWMWNQLQHQLVRE